jgi:ferredoxin
MAILKTNDNQVEVKDGSLIQEAAEQLGVLFGCRNGLCGTCMVEVEEGMENLSERNEAEDNMGLQDQSRLACQCRINQGEVKIK